MIGSDDTKPALEQRLGEAILRRRVLHGAHDLAIEGDGAEVGGDLDAADVAGDRKHILMKHADSPDRAVEDVNARRADGSANGLHWLDALEAPAVLGRHGRSVERGNFTAE